MKSLAIILIGLFVSYYVTDISSEVTAYRVFAPLGGMLFLIALALWLVLKAGAGKKSDSSSGGGGGFFGGGDGVGGDGGC